MTDSAQPFAAKKFLEIKGRRMAYIDEGEEPLRSRGVRLRRSTTPSRRPSSNEGICP